MKIRSIRHRRLWFPFTCLAVALTAQIFVLRYVWTADTEMYPRLRSIYVQTGHALHLEDLLPIGNQTVLQYSGRPPHNHLVTLEIERASLSHKTGLQLASLNPFHTPARLLYAPERGNYSVESCTVYVYVEFLNQAGATGRSLILYPPTTEDPTQTDKSRTLHIESASPLLVQIGTDSEGAQSGTHCQNLATIGDWKQSFGSNWESGFVAAPDSPVTITLSSAEPNGFVGGANELESFLELEALQPKRVFVSPKDVNEPEQVRTRAAVGAMTVSKLQLGSDFLQLELSGLVGISVSDLLGIWKIPLLIVLNLPLLVWIGFRGRTKEAAKLPTPMPSQLPVASGSRVFLSYSRRDRDGVMRIHDLLKAAGADPWIDEQDIAGGVEWELSIRQQMRNSAYVLIFLSRQSTQSAGYVWSEMRMAVQIADEQPEGKAFVIPVRLDDCVLPAILSRWNCVDVYKDGGEEKLLEALSLSGAQLPSRARKTQELTP